MTELVSRALMTAKLLLHANEENICVQTEIVSLNERIVKNRQVVVRENLNALIFIVLHQLLSAEIQ